MNLFASKTFNLLDTELSVSMNVFDKQLVVCISTTFNHNNSKIIHNNKIIINKIKIRVKKII